MLAAAISTGVDAVRAGGGGEGRGFEQRHVGDEHAVHPRLRRLRVEMVAAARHDEIGVGEDADRHRRMTRAESGEQSEAIRRPSPRRQRPRRSRLDHRPVGDRIGEGDADLQHVGAGLDQRVEDRRARFDRRIAEHDEGAERALLAREHLFVAAHRPSPSRRCACAMSLSPRPEMLTTITSASPASFRA